ncbi:arabinoxylan arabinofuranohydrolase [Paenibacillus sp. cl141a]|uniref:glycoside hydrolase family 43 protein n=1 Tax=Paenibacillus sp. cl141a TaxID=1761877 RepID=UPI0008C04B12|nr:glycoside hydrolase family 43 protein [Paenibacillus sp. cl141a]SEM57213.1 arabinoxylan arabinofuranohydrolase [Paenibacillus sp. cl141a]
MKPVKPLLVISTVFAFVCILCVFANLANRDQDDPKLLNQELSDKVTDDIKAGKAGTETMDQSSSMDTIRDADSTRSEPYAVAIGKIPPNGNPVVSHKFGADPYALVVDGRVYLYNTYDALEYDDDGNVKDNSYSTINKLSVISSSDLVNWTDHGAIQVAGPTGAAAWATQSWAPAAAHKVIHGEDRFFLYFANNASGIGVLTSDSPVGPWIDPIGKPLITRNTPGVEGVTWLFDPAVLVDDDGKAYIYFGGGIPEGKAEMPDTARVMQLGEDMVSVLGEAVTIPAPYMFEDSGINKFGGRYYYTYCSNFSGGTRPENSPPPGEIAYMVSEHPMGPWTYQGTILKNPGHFFGVGGNNHHVIFQLRQNWYIAYHAQTLSKSMGVPKGYRSTHLNRVYFEPDGTIREIEADMEGVKGIQPLNPFQRTEAVTMAWNAGIQANTSMAAEDSQGGPILTVTDIHDRDWIAVDNADFGKGASAFTAWISGIDAGGRLELRLDRPDGERIGTVDVPPSSGTEQRMEFSMEVSGASGIHHLYFVFTGQRDQRLFDFEAWKFHH